MYNHFEHFTLLFGDEFSYQSVVNILSAPKIPHNDMLIHRRTPHDWKLCVESSELSHSKFFCVCSSTFACLSTKLNNM